MITWCAVASAALSLVLAAIFVWALVTRGVLVIAGVPTLIAAAWLAHQSIALFAVRRPVSDERALASYRAVFRALMGVAAILLLGDVLLLAIGHVLSAVLAYAALTVLAVGLGVASLRSIAVAYPGCVIAANAPR